MKLLGGDGGIVDRGRGRKNAGKERMQRAAIIDVIASTSARMGTPVIAAGGVMAISVLVTGMRDGGADGRVGCCERRRNDAGKLRKYEQCDQCADKTGYCPEPLHQFNLARTVATG